MPSGVRSHRASGGFVMPEHESKRINGTRPVHVEEPQEGRGLAARPVSAVETERPGSQLDDAEPDWLICRDVGRVRRDHIAAGSRRCPVRDGGEGEWQHDLHGGSAGELEYLEHHLKKDAALDRDCFAG
ncbi:MAG: hypothetical protein M0Z49_03510 [Chloroflexi bacterium]|nr:hypothetical protein [Chloroflexota bacterium]